MWPGHFWTHVEATYGDSENIFSPNAWGNRPNFGTGETDKTGPPCMKTLRNNGEIDMTGELARLNFVVGATVKDKNGRFVTIEKATHAIVTVSYGDENTAQIKTLDFISTHRCANIVEKVTLSHHQGVTMTTRWSQELQSAKARMVLDFAWKRHFSNLQEQVTIKFKPCKQVVANGIKKLPLTSLSQLLRVYKDP